MSQKIKFILLGLTILVTLSSAKTVFAFSTGFWFPDWKTRSYTYYDDQNVYIGFAGSVGTGQWKVINYFSTDGTNYSKVMETTGNCSTVCGIYCSPSECSGTITMGGVNRGSFPAGTTVYTYAELYFDGNLIDTTGVSSATIQSVCASQFGYDLKTCYQGKCCGGSCDTSYSCSLDSGCSKESCDSTSWQCVADSSKEGGDCTADSPVSPWGVSKDSCVFQGPAYYWEANFSCVSGKCCLNSMCTSPAWTACSKGCGNSGLTKQCSAAPISENPSWFYDYIAKGNDGGLCILKTTDCSASGNADGDAIACNCDCNGYDVDERNANNNCKDGKDNDCDGKADGNDTNCDLVGPTVALSYTPSGTIYNYNDNDNKVTFTLTATDPSGVDVSWMGWTVKDKNGTVQDSGLAYHYAGWGQDPSTVSVTIWIEPYPGGSILIYWGSEDVWYNSTEGEETFNIVQTPDLTPCITGGNSGKVCGGVCDTSYSQTLHPQCSTEGCKGTSWETVPANAGGICYDDASITTGPYCTHGYGVYNCYHTPATKGTGYGWYPSKGSACHSEGGWVWAWNSWCQDDGICYIESAFCYGYGGHGTCSGNTYYGGFGCLTGGTCGYTWSDDCSDCSCSCGGYNTSESLANNNCSDGKDNNCNGKTDSSDPGCIVQKPTISNLTGPTNFSSGYFVDISQNKEGLIEAILDWDYSDPNNLGQKKFEIKIYKKSGETWNLEKTITKESSNSIYTVTSLDYIWQYNSQYYWTLKVWNSNDVESDTLGSSATTNFQTPVNRYPLVNFGFSPQNPVAKQTIIFINDSSCYDSDILCNSLEWGFGDGSPVVSTTEKEISHSYTTRGTYKISLKAKDENGYTSILTQDLRISSPLPWWREIIPF